MPFTLRPARRKAPSPLVANQLNLGILHQHARPPAVDGLRLRALKLDFAGLET
jgi:hypothetical protein